MGGNKGGETVIRIHCMKITLFSIKNGMRQRNSSVREGMGNRKMVLKSSIRGYPHFGETCPGECLHLQLFTDILVRANIFNLLGMA